MPVVPASRAEQKERTRRAILDAALRLSQDTGLAGLSLRGVTKEVGIVPTAFYRHFDSIEDLGLALVEEALVSLRLLLREVRRPEVIDGAIAIADNSVEVLFHHVLEHRDHFRFLARERSSGPAPVRESIRREIELNEHELATDLARLPGTAEWTAEDLRVVSRMIVAIMVRAAEELLETRPEQQPALAARVRTELRMLLVGALNWRSRR